MCQFLHFIEAVRLCMITGFSYVQVFFWLVLMKQLIKKSNAYTANRGRSEFKKGNHMAQFALGSIHPPLVPYRREGSICTIADPIYGFMLGYYYYMFAQYCYPRSNLP